MPDFYYTYLALQVNVTENNRIMRDEKSVDSGVVNCCIYSTMIPLFQLLQLLSIRRQSKLSYPTENDTIIAFFFEANKNKDSPKVALASSNS